MNSDGGYIRCYRRAWDNPVFRSKAEAAVFLWLVSAAAWRDGRIRTQFGPVDLRIGELLVAERDLASDFGLHRNTIRNLMQRMIDDGMIAVYRDRCAHRAGTIVSILNYAKYQIVTDQLSPKRDLKKTEETTESCTEDGPNEDRSETKIKEEKKDKEVKKEIQETTSPGASAPRNAAFGLDLLGDPPAKSARQILWADGIPIARLLTGKPEGVCRTLLGKMLRDTRDDCSRVMSILHEGQTMHPLANAEAWLTEAARGRERGNSRQPFNRLAGLKELQDVWEGRAPTPAYDIEATAEEMP